MDLDKSSTSLDGARIFYLGDDTWREAPHNTSIIHLLLSDRVDGGGLRRNGLSVSSSYLGAWEHVSFEAAMMGHIHQGWLSGGIPIWEAFLGGLFLGITKVLDPYK